MQQKLRPSQGFCCVFLIIDSKYIYATLTGTLFIWDTKVQNTESVYLTTMVSTQVYKTRSFTQLNRTLALKLLLTQQACWVSFIHFEHDKCKCQLQGIDIIGGHGLYNKAEHDGLVKKTKLILSCTHVQVCMHVNVKFLPIFSKVGKIKIC